MARTIRIHLDEHVADAVAAGLRRRGVDVTTTQEAGLLGADDPEQLAFANFESRVVFTEDADFLVLASLGLNHPGMVYCKQNTRSIGEVISAIELIWELCGPDEMRKRIEFV